MVLTIPTVVGTHHVFLTFKIHLSWCSCVRKLQYWKWERAAHTYRFRAANQWLDITAAKRKCYINSASTCSFNSSWIEQARVIHSPRLPDIGTRYTTFGICGYWRGWQALVKDLTPRRSFPRGDEPSFHGDEREEFAVCPNLDNGVPLWGMIRACVLEKRLKVAMVLLPNKGRHATAITFPSVEYVDEETQVENMLGIELMVPTVPPVWRSQVVSPP